MTMKKIYCLLMLAAAAAGCAKEEVSGTDGREPVQITGQLDETRTRTELGSDGLKVLWSANDKIGVFSASDNNTLFTLKSGAGSNSGTFEGLLTAGATPTYAYYPYSGTAGDNVAAIAMTVGTEQVQTGAAAEIGDNDFKVGVYKTGKFEFKNKLALLCFKVNDLDGSELAGLPLSKITFGAAGRDIAGSYTADLTDAAAALTPVAPAAAVTLNLDASPALTGEVTAWCMVNPAVKSGDDLVITLYAGTKKAELKVRASKDYEAGMRYMMPVGVNALVADGSMTISTSKETLPTPVVTAFRKSHGLIIAEFDFAADYPYGRKYNIELLDASNKVVRSHSGVNFKYGGSGGTNYTYLYNRYAFGDLDASTEYTVRAQLVSQNATAYDDSQWGELKVTTDAAPQQAANVLLYKDFDDVRWGGSPVDMAWGPALATATQTGADFSDEDALVFTLGHPVRCMEDAFGAKMNASFLTYHWDGWDKSGCSGVFPVCGALKFGSGGAKGVLVTPTLGSLGLTDATATVTLSFKAHAYYEPNKATGSYETDPSVVCGADFKVLVHAGAGTFANGEGAMVLTNKTPAEVGADAKKVLEWTEHSVTVTGATPETRLAVSTENTTSFRMWLDDLKIVRE